MTANDLLRSASTELTSFMSSHHYTLGRLSGCFVRRSSNSFDKRIALVVCKSRDGIGFHLDHYCEYRLHAHVDIYNRYLPYRTDKEKLFAPSISHYFFNLVPRDFDWKDVTVEAESNIPTIARNIERICTLYSFPFLDRFASADAIMQGFQGGRDTWAVQDPILRYQLLLVDGVVKQDVASFNHWYADTERFCEGRTDGQAVGLFALAQSLKKDFF